MRGAELREGAVALVGGKFSARDGIVERSANVVEAGVEHGLRDVFENCAIAAKRGGVGDAASHGACANYGDGFDFHSSCSLFADGKHSRGVIVQNFAFSCFG